jgi:hypothetical protein
LAFPTDPLPAESTFIYPDSYDLIQEHFADTWQHQNARTVLSVAALKALPVTDLTTSTAVNVLGYYAEGDGGGGIFRFDPLASAADNGGTIIAPTAGSGRWLRDLVPGPLNVKWFGARGNGVANDAPAIQAAIDFLCPQTFAGWEPGAQPFIGGTVYLPKGTYLVTANVKLPTQVTLTGDGWSTVIKGSGACTRVIECTPRINHTVMGAVIEKLCIHGGGSTGSPGTRVGIYMNQQLFPPELPRQGDANRDCKIAEVLVVYCGTGMHLVFTQGITVESSAFWFNFNGTLITDMSQLGAFYQCSFRLNLGCGLQVKGTNNEITPAWLPGEGGDIPYGWLFSRCHFESNTEYGALFDGASYNTFDTCKFENNLGSYRSNNTASGSFPDGIMFRNCIFTGTNEDKDNVHVNGSNHTFDNCGFFFNAPERIKIVSGSQWTSIIHPRGASFSLVDEGQFTSMNVLHGEANHPAKWQLNAGNFSDGRKVTLQPALELQQANQSTESGALVLASSGSPEGSHSAPRGSLYLQLDGSGGALWVKQTGSGNTGWVLK